MGSKHNKLYGVLAVLLAGLTIWAVFQQSEGISFATLLEALQGAKRGYLLIAVLGSLGMVFFEGEALLVILRGIGYPRKHRRGFLYGAADVYFSAITPSASGGQPASAFFMMQDGIPGAIVTASLLLNLIMYTLAVLSIAVLCILVRPGLYFRFQLVSRVLIFSGFVALSALTVLFYLMLKKQQVLFGIARKGVHFLSKHHLLRRPEAILLKLDKSAHEYASCVRIMKGHTPLLVGSYLCNLLQRLCQFLVILMVYMATGGEAGRLGELFVTQLYIILGSNCVPVPGGMGVTDYLMIDGYGQMFERGYAFQLEMLGRSLSFYCLVLFSAVTVLVGYLMVKREKARKVAA